MFVIAAFAVVLATALATAFAVAFAVGFAVGLATGFAVVPAAALAAALAVALAITPASQTRATVQARGLYEVNDAGIVYTEITSSDATIYSEIRMGEGVEVETEDIGDPIGAEYTCMDGKLEDNPPGLAGQEPPYLRFDPR